MRTGGKQLLLLAGAAVLTTVLYLAPQKAKKDSEKIIDPFSFESILEDSKKSLKKQEVEKINMFEAALKKDSSSLIVIDSLAQIWDNLNKPHISARYFELRAERRPDEKSWLNSAYRYFDAFKMISDSAFRKMYVEKAIACYQKVLEINPENLDAKTDLGISYAEGTSSPMQGIMLLREVIQKNPKHEMALFNLGILSVKSGQYEKAVERFESVLEVNPQNKEARFLLGRTYQLMGKTDLALKNLEPIRQTNDTEFNSEVNNLINQINNH
jgi:tetratricopeptide (TPR) repeat protein